MKINKDSSHSKLDKFTKKRQRTSSGWCENGYTYLGMIGNTLCKHLSHVTDSSVKLYTVLLIHV